MTALNKQALREAADSVIQKYGSEWFETGRQLCTVHKSKIELIAAANPATVLALLDELEAAEKRIAELTGKPANEYADDADLLFEIDFCDDLSTSIQVAQWLKELRIRRAAGIITKVGE